MEQTQNVAQNNYEKCCGTVRNVAQKNIKKSSTIWKRATNSQKYILIR